MALDIANSVILRHDAGRRLDRFADAKTYEAFVDGANRHCAERERFAPLPPVAGPPPRGLIALRESTDRHFRALVLGGEWRATLPGLLQDAAALVGDPESSALECQTALSALRLAADPPQGRIRICGHCGWLFLDRSKNRSRLWCDMAVCGNREKARRHYARNRTSEEATP